MRPSRSVGITCIGVGERRIAGELAVQVLARAGLALERAASAANGRVVGLEGDGVSLRGTSILSSNGCSFVLRRLRQLAACATALPFRKKLNNTPTNDAEARWRSA